MAYILETLNPFEPHKLRKTHLERTMTVREWVTQQYPQTGEFPQATICLFNGAPLKRAGWDREMGYEDVINFVIIPADFGIIEIITIVSVVLAIGFTIYTVLNRPKTPGEQPGSDPVFSTKGQSNDIRLGEPIEVCYGRNRIFGSLAARPYFQYKDNDQYQYMLMCIGQGEFEISDIQIGDTDISSFQEVQTQICPPGTPVTLFPTAVYTAPEAGGQTLYASNQPEYVPPGYVGPFPAGPPGEQISTIQVDVSLPKGLYRMEKSGEPKIAGIWFTIEHREIDNTGAPLGGWVLWDSPYTIIAATTTTPQRKTYTKDVTPARYEVRLARVSPSGEAISSAFGDEIVWDGLRSFLVDTTQNFGDVTLVAAILKATNNLNSRTQDRFNVVATRKLPIRAEDGTWSAPTATRSIVWAFVDAFKSAYGGRIFDDTFFDWDTLLALDSFFADRGDFFDWVFRDPITVWEAATTIARVGRATPILSGSLITMHRDSEEDIPVAMFNHENIVKGSFKWNILLWDTDEYDSVRIEYTEQSTGYKQETVLCTLPGGTTNHPNDIRIPGIQSRQQAYNEGLYIRATQKFLRENIQFETGMEGYLPTYGDLIAVEHDVPKWGSGGYVLKGLAGLGSVGYYLFLSEPVVFESGVTYQIGLRSRTGDILGPYDVTAGDNPQTVLIDPGVDDMDFLDEGLSEPMLFLFGPASGITTYLKVVKIEPQGGERIRIMAVKDNPIVYSFDGLTPPALSEPGYPPVVPDLPEITNLRLAQIDVSSSIVQANWTAAIGARYYIVQTSQDNDNWQLLTQTEHVSIQFQATPGDLWVRVSGVNVGQGPWVTEHLGVGFLISLGLLVPWDDVLWTVQWNAVLVATGYEVKVYDNTIGGSPVLKRTEDVTDREYTYNFAKAQTDTNLVRKHRVEVLPIFPPADDGTPTDPGTPISLDLENDEPATPPGSPTSVMGTVTAGVSVQYDLSWTVPAIEDLIRVAVWLDTTSGFDPNVVVPVYDHTEPTPGSATIPTTTTVTVPLVAGAHPAQYWRVAVFDCWGNEINLNITAEQTIAAYP